MLDYPGYEPEYEYSITAKELIEICEAIQDGYSLELQSDEIMLSVELNKNDQKMTYNFLRQE